MNKIALVNILSTILLQGIHILSAPIFSRLMSTSSYGVVSIYTTWLGVSSLVMGFQTSGTLVMAKSAFEEREQAQYQSSVLSLSIAVFFLGGVSTAIFPSQIANLFGLDVRMLPVMLLHACGNYCVGFLNTKYVYEFHAARNLLIAVGTSLSILGLSLVFVLNLPREVNYWGRIWGMAITECVIGAAAIIYIFAQGKTWFHKQYWKFCVRLAVPLLIHRLSGIVLNYCDKVMLQRMLGNSQVGIYSIALALATIISTIWSALNNAWIPFYYEFSRKNQIREVKKHGKNYLEFFTVLTVGFMLLAPEVFHIMAAEAYWAGTTLISSLALGYYFVFLYSFPVNFEFFHQKTKATAMSTMLAGICNIILNALLIPKWGIMGAAVATMLAHVLQFAIHHVCALYIRGGSEYPFPLRILVPYVIVACGVAIWTTYSPGHWLVRWGTGAIIGIFELLRIYKRKSLF